MGWTDSQILIVVGVVFQSISVLYQVNETYHLFKSKKYKKEKSIGWGQKPATIDQITKAMKTWLLSLLLFFIGVVLQGYAEFVR
jgi:hypothetical protein